MNLYELVVFRIEPGQQVATHTSASSVFLSEQLVLAALIAPRPGAR